MLIDDVAIDGTPIAHLTSGSAKRVLAACDGCGKQLNIMWSNYLQGQRVPGRNGKTYCHKCAAAVAGLSAKGRKSPEVAAANRRRRGSKHASWRGGRYLDREGYVMILTNAASSGAGWSKYEKEHILVMRQHLGRLLLPEEVVHHIDNDKENNVIDNLFLTTNSGHRLAHISLTLAFQLLRAAGLRAKTLQSTTANAWSAYHDGLIEFDRTQGIYVANLKSRELLEQPTAAGGANQQPSSVGTR